MTTPMPFPVDIPEVDSQWPRTNLGRRNPPRQTQAQLAVFAVICMALTGACGRTSPQPGTVLSSAGGGDGGAKALDQSTCEAGAPGTDQAWRVVDLSTSPTVLDVPASFAVAQDGTLGVVGLAAGAAQTLAGLPLGLGLASPDCMTWRELALPPGQCGASTAPGVAFADGTFAVTRNQPLAPNRQVHLHRVDVAGKVLCEACLPDRGPALPFAWTGQLWLADAVPPLPSTKLRMAKVGSQCTVPAAGVAVDLPVPPSSAIRPIGASCSPEVCALVIDTALGAPEFGGSGVYGMSETGTVVWSWTAPPLTLPPTVRWLVDGTGWIVAWKTPTATGWALRRLRVAPTPPYAQEYLADITVVDPVGHTWHRVAVGPDGQVCTQIPYDGKDLSTADVLIGCFDQAGALAGMLRLRLPSGDRFLSGGWVDGRWVWYVDVGLGNPHAARIFIGPADGTMGLGKTLGAANSSP